MHLERKLLRDSQDPRVKEGLGSFLNFLEEHALDATLKTLLLETGLVSLGAGDIRRVCAVTQHGNRAAISLPPLLDMFLIVLTPPFALPPSTCRMRSRQQS